MRAVRQPDTSHARRVGGLDIGRRVSHQDGRRSARAQQLQGALNWSRAGLHKCRQTMATADHVRYIASKAVRCKICVYDRRRVVADDGDGSVVSSCGLDHLRATAVGTASTTAASSAARSSSSTQRTSSGVPTSAVNGSTSSGSASAATVAGSGTPACDRTRRSRSATSGAGSPAKIEQTGPSKSIRIGPASPRTSLSGPGR